MLPALTAAQRQAITTAAGQTSATPHRTIKLPARRAAWARWALATAACAALAGAVAWNVFNAPDKPVAHNDKVGVPTPQAVSAPTTSPNGQAVRGLATSGQPDRWNRDAFGTSPLTRSDPSAATTGSNALGDQASPPGTASASTTLNWQDQNGHQGTIGQGEGLALGQGSGQQPITRYYQTPSLLTGKPGSGPTNSAGTGAISGVAGTTANTGLALDGINSYTGQTTVNGGLIIAGNGTSTGGVPAKAPAGGPGYGNTTTFDISGAQGINKSGAGTLTLNGATLLAGDPAKGSGVITTTGVPTTPLSPVAGPVATPAPHPIPPVVLATNDLKKVADNPLTKAREGKGVKLLEGEKESDDRFANYAKPGEPAVATGEQLVKQRKETFHYAFQDQLGRAQDAVARGERERAVAEIGKAKETVQAQLAMLTVDELSVVNARLAQVETALNNNESYARLNDNPFKVVAGDAKAEPLSTFSIDVDTASYSNVRRFLDAGQLPPPDAVRIEELLNYFPYGYEQPAKDAKEPFKAVVEVAGCPWNSSHRLARVAIKGKEIAHDKRPVSNLVFLIDVSGSMNEPKKLPLVKEGLQMMVKELTENDRVAIVVYAGAAGLVLPSTCADPMGKEKILGAIENLSAGGSTNGAHGIQLAYNVAAEHFIKGGTNRVILATDGDWNVGITDKTSLDNLIVEQAKSGVFLSALGFGFGNLKDSTLESISNKGNGHYAYIDDQKEARKVLVEEMSGTLVTIAKDVKIQVEFNPAKVESYRLIGYENRMLRAQDFNNDKIDAGEIGAGHCVTALYEIVPADPNKKPVAPAPKPESGQAKFGVIVDVAAAAAAAAKAAGIDPLIYADRKSDDLLTLKLRYKAPEGDTSTKLAFPARDSGASYAKASDDFKFAAAVAQFGMVLRNSPHKGSATLAGVIELADEAKGKDEKGYRKDFVELAKKAKAISKQQ